MQKLKSVSELADKFDAFILDVWGVIHDGHEAYPGVLECMQKLHAAGKKIIFLSNAPRRSHKVKQVLAKFGITEDLYLDAVSSGEVGYETIKALGAKNYFYIGPEKDRDLLSGLGLKETPAHEAEIAVVTGFDNDNSTLEEKLPQMKEALSANLKMYCVNPDLLVVRQNGSKMLCAGVIGEEYQKMGGKVEFVGKPHKKVYEKCFALFGSIPKSRIVAVGDNLDTDIAGGNSAGVASVLCLSGVLKDSEQPYCELVKETGFEPKFVIDRFNW